MSVRRILVLGLVVVVTMVLYAGMPRIDSPEQEEPAQVAAEAAHRATTNRLTTNLRPAPIPQQSPASRTSKEVGSVVVVCNSDVNGYYNFVSTLLNEDLGAELTAAVYDPDMLNVLATEAAQGKLKDDDDFVWHINKLRSPPVAPKSFSRPASMLRLTKRLVSVGIGRLHRDSEMARLYAHTCSNPAAAAVFRRAIRRVIEAYVNYFYTMVQLSMDAMEHTMRHSISETQKAADQMGDVMTIIMTHVDHTTSVSDLEGLLNLRGGRDGDLFKLVEKQFLQLGSRGHPGKEIIALFPLEYEAEPFGGQRPVNGKFWNMIRPTASCASLVRLCEKPDGCRLLCNAEYLLHAGTTISSQPFRHRLAGFGSNNEYDWETSLVKMFQQAERSAVGRSPVHGVGWFTVFDCTLGSGARAWAPPKFLTETPIGFGYASKCLDATTTATSYGFQDVKRVLLGSESAHRANTNHESVTRRTVSAEAIKANPLEHKLRVNAARLPSVRWFDGISILKVDVEGYEFNAIPAWGRDELRNLGTTGKALVQSGSTQLIDFEEMVDDYLSVSLLSMEFHRSGHKYNHGANLNGAQRAHYTLLHIYSLGFIMAGQEKNHQDNCCYELVWVHYRHFVRSEVWMVVGDSF